MASNLTTDNIKTLSQLETIDVSNEKDAYFLCGNGQKMNKIAFNRLRKKVNGTILPTKKPKNAELGELWLEAESIADENKRIKFYPDLLKEKALTIFVDGVIYFLQDKKAFKMKIDKETTETHYHNLRETLFDDFSFDLLVFTKDLIVFFNKEDVTLSKAIKRESGEIIGLNENYSGSIPYEVLEIQNLTYPMENLNGVLFDNTDAMQFQFITFELSSDGATFGYKALATLNYSELGTVNGAKVCGLVMVNNGSYDAENSKVAIFPKIDGAYYIEDLKLCDHDIKFTFVSAYVDKEIEKDLSCYIFIGDNQATQFNAEKGTLEPFNLYTDETTLAECVGGVQVLNGFYLLQKTSNDGVSLQKENFTLVKYFIDEDLTLKAKKIKTFTISNGQAFSISTLLKNYYGMFIDTKDALSTMDGLKENDIFICYQFADTSKYIDFLYSDYEYKMMLSYGDTVQEIQGYKGEKGDNGKDSDIMLSDLENHAIYTSTLSIEDLGFEDGATYGLADFYKALLLKFGTKTININFSNEKKCYISLSENNSPISLSRCNFVGSIAVDGTINILAQNSTDCYLLGGNIDTTSGNLRYTTYQKIAKTLDVDNIKKQFTTKTIDNVFTVGNSYTVEEFITRLREVFGNGHFSVGINHSSSATKKITITDDDKSINLEKGILLGNIEGKSTWKNNTVVYITGTSMYFIYLMYLHTTSATTTYIKKVTTEDI